MISAEAKKIIKNARHAYPNPTSLRVHPGSSGYCVGHAVISTVSPKAQHQRFPHASAVWEYLKEKYNLPETNKVQVYIAIDDNDSEQFESAWTRFEAALTTAA